MEYGKDSLSIQESAIAPYKKFVIIDDLLATGGTAKCVIDMLRSRNKEILALSVIIELSFLNGSKNLDIPVFSKFNIIVEFRKTHQKNCLIFKGCEIKLFK